MARKATPARVIGYRDMRGGHAPQAAPAAALRAALA